MTSAVAPRIGYLGPAGTFTEEALLTQEDLASCDLVPFASIDAVLEAVTSGGVEMGFVPIENSIEGTVSATIDSLIFDHDLLIVREVVIDIHLHLVGMPGATLADVTEVWSYPHAIAQCRRFAASRVPNAVLRASNSTADAARLVAETKEPRVAAIAPNMAAKIYQLAVIEENIEDHSDNQTRFILVRTQEIPAATGSDKTSVVCFQRSDQPGSLFSILAEFYARNINLTKLESRPSKRGLGQYCFAIEFEGHVSDHDVADTLVGLKRKLADVKFLGSFPDSAQRVSLAPHSSDQADSAWNWLGGIRSQIEKATD